MVQQVGQASVLLIPVDTDVQGLGQPSHVAIQYSLDFFSCFVVHHFVRASMLSASLQVLLSCEYSKLARLVSLANNYFLGLYTFLEALQPSSFLFSQVLNDILVTIRIITKNFMACIIYIILNLLRTD